MKTIGILGGLGPQATMDLEARIHSVSQKLMPQQQGNSGYPPMVVYYCRHPPVLLNEDGSPVLPIQPDPRILDAAARLGSIADFIIISSNGPHMLQAELEEASGRKILSMIELTLAEVQHRGLAKVGVLTYGPPFVYQIPLENLGIPFEVVPEEIKGRLDTAIIEYMAGKYGPDAYRAALDAVSWLREQGADGIILGCTEIPLLLGEAADAPDLINPAQLLAEAAVQRSISN